MSTGSEPTPEDIKLVDEIMALNRRISRLLRQRRPLTGPDPERARERAKISLDLRDTRKAMVERQEELKRRGYWFTPGYVIPRDWPV